MRFQTRSTNGCPTAFRHAWTAATKDSELEILPVLSLQNPEVRNLLIKGFPTGVQVVALGNLCGDSKEELILGSDSTLYICTVVGDSASVLYSHSFDKPVLKLRTGDADNDGKNDLVLITGYTQYTDSEVNVFVVKYNEGKCNLTLVYTKASPRPQPLLLTIVTG